MPSKDEIERARPMANEVMSPLVDEYKAKKISARDVGDAAMRFASEAKGESHKFVLLSGAVHYYSLEGDFDKSADAIEAICSQIKDVPPSKIEEAAAKALERAGKNDAQRLRTIYRAASRRAKASKDIGTFKAALGKKSSDTDAKRGLADAFARYGDWPNALIVFSQLDIAAAAFELNPDDSRGYDALKAADYWWSFEAKDPAPYRAHAVGLYRRAIAEGLVQGLRRSLVDKRIAEAEALGVPLPLANSAVGDKLYCVVDLSGGPNAAKYPVSYLSTAPKGGWTDEYKTTKLVLRRIEPGTFIMGGDQKNVAHRVNLTKPYYIGVFEVTQCQYELVMGNNPSSGRNWKNDGMCPVSNVSCDMLRGNSKEYNWPTVKTVNSNSFFGRLRDRTGNEGFDLPTHAQWEYACRAGTTSPFNNGGSSEKDMLELGRFLMNQTERRIQKSWGKVKWREPDESYSRHQPDGKGNRMAKYTVVGMYKPNAWGLYDMHGNVKEWTINGWSNYGSDPIGPENSQRKLLCGGTWDSMVQECTSSSCHIQDSKNRHEKSGFRLVLCLDK